MDTRKAVAKRIKDLCEGKGITIYRLTQLSGVPHSTLTSIFSGTSKNPGIVTISKICKALDIPLSKFFDCDLFD